MNRFLPPDITCTQQHSGAVAIYTFRHREHGELGRIGGPLGKRKISYAKPVFCTDCCLLSVTNGIFPVPA